jgi:hypothetical protein
MTKSHSIIKDYLNHVANETNFTDIENQKYYFNLMNYIEKPFNKTHGIHQYFKPTSNSNEYQINESRYDDFMFTTYNISSSKQKKHPYLHKLCKFCTNSHMVVDYNVNCRVCTTCGYSQLNVFFTSDNTNISDHSIIKKRRYYDKKEYISRFLKEYDIPKNIQNDICKFFNIIIGPLLSIYKTKNRKIFNYNYIVRKILVHLNYNEYLILFKKLKESNRRYSHDDIWNDMLKTFQ